MFVMRLFSSAPLSGLSLDFFSCVKYCITSGFGENSSSGSGLSNESKSIPPIQCVHNLSMFSHTAPPPSRSSLILHPRMPCSNHTAEWEHPNASAVAENILQSPEWNQRNPSPSCQCSTSTKLTMMPICPEGAGGRPPPQRREVTADTMLDLTGRNISDYLVKTYPSLIKARWVEPLQVEDQLQVIATPIMWHTIV